MQKQEAERRFEQAIREHELLLYKICRVYTNTDADRQDLFQEIVIQLWKAFPKFKGDAQISTWMYRVAINAAISGLRKQKHSVVSGSQDIPEHIKEEQYNPAEEEKLNLVYAAIAQLNEIEKAIVMLYMEDKSYNEMEDILGISQGNLRVKMTRIKDKLRQLTKN